MIFLGYKRALTSDDLWPLNEENKTKYNSELFHQRLQQNQKTNRKGILIPILTTYWFYIVLMIVLKLGLSFLPYVNPMVLNWLIDYMSEGNTDPEWRGYLYAVIMFMSPMIESVLSSQYDAGTGVTALRVRSCITNAIYRKVYIFD